MEQIVLEACQYCKEHGIEIISDLNYRRKMWEPEQAQATISKIMEFVTVCIAHDEDFEATLGIKAFDGDDSRGIEQKENV